MELETSVSKILKECQNTKLQRPVHLNITVDTHLTAGSFMQVGCAFEINFLLCETDISMM
jgi:hypothetical protein